MSALHVHGQVTPTSKVIRNPRGLTSPFKRNSASQSSRPSTTARPKRPAKSSGIDESHITGLALGVVSAADFTGLDVLSGIDYLKRLQTDLPARMSTQARTRLLNRRRALPSIVLAHQLASLFPSTPGLEKDIHALVRGGRIVELALQDGTVGYIRAQDYACPAANLATQGIQDLPDSQFRELAQEGWLLRRNGQVFLSAPNIGTYFSALRAARKYVMAHLRRNIVLEKDIKLRYEQWRDGGLFQFENLMHDLVGSGRVEVLMLTTGRALRLTKRGRDER